MAGLEEMIETLSELDRVRDEVRDIRKKALEWLVRYDERQKKANTGTSAKGTTRESSKNVDLVEKANVKRALRLCIRERVEGSDAASAAMKGTGLESLLDLSTVELKQLIDIDEEAIPLFSAPRVMHALVATPGSVLCQATAFCYYSILRALYTPARPEWTTGGVRAGSGGATTAFVTSECVRAVLALARVLTRTKDFLQRVGEWQTTKKRVEVDHLSESWKESEKERANFALYVDFLHRQEDLIIELDMPSSPADVEAKVDGLREQFRSAIAAGKEALRRAIEKCNEARVTANHLMRCAEKAACPECTNTPPLHDHPERSRTEDETESGHRRAMRVLEDALAHWETLAKLILEPGEISWSTVAAAFERGAARVRRTLRPAEHFVRSVLDRELAIAASDVPQHCDYTELAFAAAAYGALRNSAGALPEPWDDVHLQRAAKILANDMLVDGVYPVGRPIHVMRQGFRLHVVGFEMIRVVADLLRNTRIEFGPDVAIRMLRLFRETRNPDPDGGWGHEQMPTEKTSLDWTTALCATAAHHVIDMLDKRINHEVSKQFLNRQPPHVTLGKLFIGDHGLTPPSNVAGNRPSISRYAERMRAHLLGAPLPETLWSIILYGPPGTGKTTIAEALAFTAGVPLIEVTPSDLIVAGMEEVERKARTVMRALSMLTDAVILFDEFDSMVKRRETPEQHTLDGRAVQSKQSIFEFLTPGMLPKLKELHGAAKRHRVVYLLATNRIDDLDKAAIRGGRFDEKVGLYPPDLLSRTGRLVSEVTEYQSPGKELTAAQRERIAEIILRTCGSGMTDLGKPGWFTAPGADRQPRVDTPFHWILKPQEASGEPPESPRPEEEYKGDPLAKNANPYAWQEWIEWGFVHDWDEAFQDANKEGRPLWEVLQEVLGSAPTPRKGPDSRNDAAATPGTNGSSPSLPPPVEPLPAPPT